MTSGQRHVGIHRCGTAIDERLVQLMLAPVDAFGHLACVVAIEKEIEARILIEWR